ncbi:hypothetical protein AVEN_199524-1 [Araneus ventricosus]|uniref:Uncharacterized protein n=1 Tax=Araneus ventricosus TaxID=182803 RepID=A0A4Y2TSM0_ARAVE|nr:hypothetical protein AVEN_199524-1 [Araneus ventricosus]
MNAKVLIGQRWPGGKFAVSGPEDSSFETRFHKRTGVKADMVHVNPVRTKLPVAGGAWKFQEGVSNHGSSSSSDHCSNLQDPSQNSPRVASKRAANYN